MHDIDEKVILMWKWYENQLAGIDTTIDDQDIPWLHAHRELEQLVARGDDYAFEVLLRIIALAPQDANGDDSFISTAHSPFFRSFWDNASESVKLRARTTSDTDKQLWSVMHWPNWPGWKSYASN